MSYHEQYSYLLQSKKFSNCKTNRERIEFIVKFVRPLSQFRRKFHQRVDKYCTEKSGKSAVKSREYIEAGIRLYHNQDYKKSISWFKRAILWAPFPSEGSVENLLGLAFAYKSSAEFDLKDYPRALLSANNSLELYDSIQMLIIRVHCLRFMARYKESLECLNDLIGRYHQNESIYSKHGSLENLDHIKSSIIKKMSANCKSIAQKMDSCDTLKTMCNDMKVYNINVLQHPSCQLKRTERKGRHTVTTHFIPKGTVVLMEWPTSVVINDNMRYYVCSNCHKEAHLSIWPCSTCNEVVFCNKQCFIEAYEAYHKYECGITGFLYSIGRAVAHTYQLITKAGVQKAFQCEEQNKSFDFEKYLETMRQKLLEPITDQTEKERDFETEFEASYALENNDSKHNIPSNIVNSFKAIETVLLFDYKRNLYFDVEKDFQKFLTFADICAKMNRRVITNVFGWSGFLPNSPLFGRKVPIGSGYCNVSSLFNHSCQPNVTWEWEDCTIVFTANKDINAGEEVCDSYVPYLITPFLQRQKKLKDHYFFDCNCKTCLSECQTVLCIRCRHCSGPVVNTDEPITRDRCCLQCGHVFTNLQQTVSKVETLKHIFHQMITHLGNDYNIEDSLKTIERVFMKLMKLVYGKSLPLRQCFKQLIRAYVRLNRFADAVQCIEYFGSSNGFNYETISGDIFDDLVLLTDCYYMYLNESQGSDTNHWNNCFHLYSKLFSFLKRGQNELKQIPKNGKQIVDNTQQMRHTFEEKQIEFVKLKQLYKSRFN